MGVVMRDAVGGFIAAAHSYIPHVVDAAMVEAFALKDGFLLAQQIGCNRVEIQADRMEAVTTMNEGGFSATAAPLSMMNVVNTGWWMDFAAISISHCNRDCN